MSNTAIRIENLSKQYRLGEVGTGTLSHDLNRWWAAVRGKEDPYSKVTATNDRTVSDHSEYVWALKDINFEVQQGEILGIIGKNGAGKSTLLKILSKVTGPTTGRIKTRGRIASLLEVGTGFHPEMTGRENIYMNGTLNGMRRHEIKTKLDEIVEFSGVAKYLDTPTKRYSSGMTVRLGFAVAAFLEPEILVVDEVLAVGDAEFQKRAIGKMQEVSQGEGRTVLFVSHNLSSVRALCQSCLLLLNGKAVLLDKTSEVIDQYLITESSSGFTKSKSLNGVKRQSDAQLQVEFHKVELNQLIYSSSDELILEVSCVSEIVANDSLMAISIKDSNGSVIYHLASRLLACKCRIRIGHNRFQFVIPQLRLKEGVYHITLFHSISDIVQDWIIDAISFQVEESSIYPFKDSFKIQAQVQSDFQFISCK